MERTVEIAGKREKINLSRVVHRYKNNPIVTCHDVNKVWHQPHLKVVTVHNAGITQYKGEVLMLFRSHLRNGISILGIARSKDGLTDWRIDPNPALMPCDQDDEFIDGADKEQLIANEGGGLEDARISQIGKEYFITYSAYHGSIQHKVRVSLAVTTDFQNYKRYGPVLETDMRNVVIFPEIIGNHYYALFRPNDSTDDHTGGIFKQILLGKTSNCHSNSWDVNPIPIMNQSGLPSFFSDKIGPGATPIKTKHGWINIFHGVRSTMDGNPYFLGVAIHELADVTKIRIANFPILMPSKADCKVPEDDYIHVPQVVFCCGAIRKANGEIYIYYGGNDTVMNVGITHEDLLAELCDLYPQDPSTGVALFNLKSK
ncbi:MAG: glycosidase [Bacteroidia bacterium]|nr:glycosidase [Bacteroidia bacterium]